MWLLCPMYKALASSLHQLGWSHTGFIPTFWHSAIMMDEYDPDVTVVVTTLKPYVRAGTLYSAPKAANLIS